jgi:chemotaxis protein MotB
MASKRNKGDGANIVIKKEEVVAGGHHGGAWKVAYADFVTAMMAFFLLMWLLNATTEEQRKGLADYFSPMSQLSRNNSGNGEPFGGHTPYDEGAMVSDKGVESIQPGRKVPSTEDENDPTAVTPARPVPPPPDSAAAPAQADAAGNAAHPVDQDGEHAPGGGVAASPASTPSRAEFLANAGAGALAKPDLGKADEGALRAELGKREQAAFQAAAAQIREAVRNDPELATLARQLAIDVTPEGLRVQLLDEDHQSMFPSGSAEMNERGQLLLHKIAPVLARLAQPLVVTGHTDAQPYKGSGRTNWELSSDRAGATRRLLAEGGLPDARFREVSGRADREPLLPADPLAAANRRISILVQSSVLPPASPPAAAK